MNDAQHADANTDQPGINAGPNNRLIIQCDAIGCPIRNRVTERVILTGFLVKLKLGFTARSVEFPTGAIPGEDSE